MWNIYAKEILIVDGAENVLLYRCRSDKKSTTDVSSQKQCIRDFMYTLDRHNYARSSFNDKNVRIRQTRPIY